MSIAQLARRVTHFTGAQFTALAPARTAAVSVSGLYAQMTDVQALQCAYAMCSINLGVSPELRARLEIVTCQRALYIALTCGDTQLARWIVSIIYPTAS